MQRVGAAFLIWVLGLHSITLAWDPAGPYGRNTKPVPPNAKITLSTDREEYFFGENVLVHVTLENTGDAPFTIDVGGDYSGSKRAYRYEVRGFGDGGEELADSNSTIPHTGGMLSTHEVTRETPFCESLPVCHYLRFERPGVYQVRVRHDFGWKETPDQPHPVGEITLTLRQPSPEQTDSLVWEWLGKRFDTHPPFGKKRPPYPDFTQIRNPEFLPALTEAAQMGQTRAVVGIDSIITREATKTLINCAVGIGLEGLGEAERRRVQDSAIHKLWRRVPQPRFAVGKYHNERFATARRWVVEHTWDARLEMQSAGSRSSSSAGLRSTAFHRGLVC